LRRRGGYSVALIPRQQVFRHPSTLNTKHEANLAILVVSASSDRKLMVGELGK
jgi:hypothetical protein